jgi:hypothetical protein
MDKISSSVSPVKKGQLRRTGRYFCIKTLLVGIQTDRMALVYYNKLANAKTPTIGEYRYDSEDHPY